MRVKGTGVGQKVKGKESERTLKGRYVCVVSFVGVLWENVADADDNVIGWRRDGRLCWRCRRWCRRGKRYVLSPPFPEYWILEW